jgi:hypothetical protein
VWLEVNGQIALGLAIAVGRVRARNVKADLITPRSTYSKQMARNDAVSATTATLKP